MGLWVREAGVTMALDINTHAATVTGSHSFLRVLLKKKAHSEQVFLLLTQNTADIPTTSVIKYFTKNRERSGRSDSAACSKAKAQP